MSYVIPWEIRPRYNCTSLYYTGNTKQHWTECLNSSHDRTCIILSLTRYKDNHKWWSTSRSFHTDSVSHSLSLRSGYDVTVECPVRFGTLQTLRRMWKLIYYLLNTDLLSMIFTDCPVRFNHPTILGLKYQHLFIFILKYIWCNISNRQRSFINDLFLCVCSANEMHKNILNCECLHYVLRKYIFSSNGIVFI